MQCGVAASSSARSAAPKEPLSVAMCATAAAASTCHVLAFVVFYR